VGWNVGDVSYIETVRGHVGYRAGGAGSVSADRETVENAMGWPLRGG
jgi:hypothetical protein